MNKKNQIVKLSLYCV